MPSCPKCNKELTRKYPRRQIFECAEHGLFKLVHKRRKRRPFDINDKSTWRATCDECGCKDMEYYNFRYMCPRCGYMLEV